MSDSSPTAPLRLRSPFNGEAWPVPPDATPEFVAELEKRGFARIETVPVKALQAHTYHDQAYAVGDEYACDDVDVESVEVQGKAVRVKRPRGEKPAADKGAYKTTTVGETRTTDLSDATPKK